MNKTANWIVVCNVILELGFYACVTYAACHFDRVGILAWYLLGLGIGYTWKEKGPDNG